MSVFVILADSYCTYIYVRMLVIKWACTQMFNLWYYFRIEKLEGICNHCKKITLSHYCCWQTVGKEQKGDLQLIIMR